MWQSAAQCQSSSLDVGSLLALRVLRHFKRDALIFLERLEASHLDGREMYGQFFTAFVRQDETETLDVVKPFDHAGCCESPFIKTQTRTGRDVPVGTM